MSRDLIGRPMEILLVEDGLTDARLTIANLKKGQVKHRLTLVRDGSEALEFLRRDGKFARAPRPDLVLLDLHLPKIDGLEVLAQMKADESLASIPVVVLTSSDEDSPRRQSEELGVDAYITKPVDLAKFLAVVRQLRTYWRADLLEALEAE